MSPLNTDFMANRTATKEAAGPESLKGLEENKGGRKREEKEGLKTNEKRNVKNVISPRRAGCRLSMRLYLSSVCLW